jgi:hypothetical protein
MIPARALTKIPLSISPGSDVYCEQGILQNVPVVCCCRRSLEKYDLPVIIFSPGFALAQPGWTETLTRFVECGYRVIGVIHRDRGIGKMQPVTDRHLLARQWRYYIDRAAQEISALIDYFSHAPSRASRFGVLGADLGGCIAYRALLTDARIRLGLALIHRSPALPELLNEAALRLPANSFAPLLPPSPDLAGRRDIPAPSFRPGAYAPQRLNLLVRDDFDLEERSATREMIFDWVSTYL